MTVLIPLNSGLVFTLLKNGLSLIIGGLNPFEFRASIYSHSDCMGRVLSGLNPFEFRASIYS